MSGCGGVYGPPELWEIMRLTPESGGISHPLFQTQYKKGAAQIERPIEKWLKSDLRSIFGRDSEARTKGNQGDRDRLGEIKKRDCSRELQWMECLVGF